MEITLDNTKIEQFRSCPAMFFLSSLGFDTQNGSSALRYGSTWHGFLEGYYNALKNKADYEEKIQSAVKRGQKVWMAESKDKTFFSDYRTQSNCATAFLEYMNEFPDDNVMNIIDTERAFKIKMNPTTVERALFNLSSAEIYFTGMIDLQVEDYGVPWIWDHKSTGYPPKTIAFKQEKSPQLKGYTFATYCLDDIESQGCILNIHQLLSRKKKDGNYGKLSISFLRQPIIFSGIDIHNWRSAFLQTAGEVIQAKEKSLWSMQTGSCSNYGSCKYLSICENMKCEELIQIDADDARYNDFIINPWDVLLKHPNRKIMYGEDKGVMC